MKRRAALALLIALWAHGASAQSVYPDRPLTVRVTGTLLLVQEGTREDVVTVRIFIEGQPWLLRVGQVEKLTADERERAVDDDILLREVRFYGPNDLIGRLQKPEIAGKVLTIEGRLDTKEKRFLVTAVKEPGGGSDPQHQPRE